jgi:hypothetical protein
MIRKLWIGKNTEESGGVLIRGIIQALARMDWRKPRNLSKKALCLSLLFWGRVTDSALPYNMKAVTSDQQNTWNMLTLTTKCCTRWKDFPLKHGQNIYQTIRRSISQTVIFNIKTDGRRIANSRDRSVGTEKGYGLEGLNSIPSRVKFFSSSQRPDRLRPTQPPIKWVPGTTFQGLKRPGREADHSPPSSVEAKNGGAIPPLPICFHGIMLN